MIVLRIPLSSLRWRTRLTLWLAAVCAGLAVVAFAKLAELSLSLFYQITTAYPWTPFLLAPSVGMITVWLTVRYVPGAQEAGFLR